MILARIKFQFDSPKNLPDIAKDLKKAHSRFTKVLKEYMVLLKQKKIPDLEYNEEGDESEVVGTFSTSASEIGKTETTGLL